MERRVTTARNELEQMLLDENVKPKALHLSLLEDITDGFSHDQQIGSGGFAVVYKGVLGDRVVAVKRLTNPCMDEREFHREIECLMLVKHKNIVRFLGYCADRQGTMESYDGKLVMADVHQRLLCFEYIPKGTLAKYIIDANREWGTCYGIIKGICEGIRYLHKHDIIHLDLKPANILLDDDMIPKITDFGLSRLFEKNQNQHITKNKAGTLGYLAPELIDGGVITRSNDLYSLGFIIIEILTGHKVFKAIEDVLESWSVKFEMSERQRLCEQIQLCYEIAFECKDFNPAKRPTSAQNIIDRLHELESIQNADKGGGAKLEKNIFDDKNDRCSEQKKNQDICAGDNGHKKNPNMGSAGSEQKDSFDRGDRDDKQKKNDNRGDRGGEEKKNLDAGFLNGEQGKNSDNCRGGDKVDMAGSLSQPKDDKEKKQPPKEKKPTMHQPYWSVNNVIYTTPQSTRIQEKTVLLKIPIDCNVCVERIQRHIYKVEGVKFLVVDIAKNEVKVVGTMDVAAMVVYLEEKLGRTVEAACTCPKKKHNKKDKGDMRGDGDNKKKGKSGVERHAQKVKAKGIDLASPSMMSMPASVGSPYGNTTYVPRHSTYYGGNASVVKYEEDDNPCSIM